MGRTDIDVYQLAAMMGKPIRQSELTIEFKYDKGDRRYMLMAQYNRVRLSVKRLMIKSYHEPAEYVGDRSYTVWKDLSKPFSMENVPTLITNRASISSFLNKWSDLQYD